MLEFRTLGTIDVREADGDAAAPQRPRAVLGQPKRLAILAYLTVARPTGPVRRDSLLAVFWSDSSDRRARNALNQAVFALRRDLGSDVILTRGDSLEVDPEVLWCDARAFRAAIDADDLTRALELYGGPFLPGLHVSDCREFERWLDEERRRLRQRAVEGATGLVERALANGNHVAAVRWLARAGELAPYDEDILRRHLALLDELGDRVGALRTYERFRLRLMAELELTPSARTVELVSRIDEDHVESTAEPGTAIPDGAGTLSTPDPDPPEATERWPSRAVVTGGLLATFAIALMVALVLEVSADGDGPRIWPETLDPNRVLVASLANRTGEDSLDVIGDLAADWISHELARTGLARVVPSTLVSDADRSGSSPNFDATEPDGQPVSDWRRLAQRVGAGVLVRGSFARSSGRLVFETGVFDVDSGTLLRSLEPVTSTTDDALSAITTVRERLAGVLATVLDPRMRSWSAAASQPPDIEAYRLYARGMDEYAELDFRAANQSFLAAAELDSTFTAPLIWAMQLPIHGNSEVVEMGQALEARREALAPWDRAMLDYRIARARGALGAAYSAMLQVVDLVPRSHWWLEAAELALMLNAPLEALEHLERAAPHRADPIAPNRFWVLETRALHVLERFEDELSAVDRWREAYPNRGLGSELRAMAALGRHAEVEERLRELLSNRAWSPGLARFAGDMAAELRAHGASEAGQRLQERIAAYFDAAPDSFWTDRRRYVEYGRAVAAAGRLTEARDVFASLLRDEVLPEVVRGDLGVLAAQLGNRERAERMAAWFAEASDREAPYGGGWYKQWEARIVASLGRKAEAVRHLREAYARGWAHLLSDHREPDFEPLRGYPPYERLMRPRRLTAR